MTLDEQIQAMPLMQQGIVCGMRDMGAYFAGKNGNILYFNIEPGSEIDTKDMLIRSKNVLYELGFVMKIKRLPTGNIRIS